MKVLAIVLAIFGAACAANLPVVPVQHVEISNSTVPSKPNLPVNSSVPVNPSLPINSSLPVSSSLPINASLPVSSQIPVNSSLPVNPNGPIQHQAPTPQGKVPIQGVRSARYLILSNGQVYDRISDLIIPSASIPYNYYPYSSYGNFNRRIFLEDQPIRYNVEQPLRYNVPITPVQPVPIQRPGQFVVRTLV